MPSQDGVGRNDRRDPRKQPAAERLALRLQPATLLVGQPEEPAAQVFPQDAVLLGAAGQEFYFATRDEQPSGLWRSDGTAAGTARLSDLSPRPQLFANVAGRVYIDHHDLALGREPWVFDAGATAKSIGTGCGVGLRAPILEATDPVLGGVWSVRGGYGAPGSIGVLLLGPPAPMPAIHPGHCVDHIAAGQAAVLHRFADASAPWWFHATIPNAPSLIDVQLVAQAWSGPSANPAGVEASNAVWLSLDTW